MIVDEILEPQALYIRTCVVPFQKTEFQKRKRGEVRMLFSAVGEYDFRRFHFW